MVVRLLTLKTKQAILWEGEGTNITSPLFEPCSGYYDIFP